MKKRFLFFIVFMFILGFSSLYLNALYQWVQGG